MKKYLEFSPEVQEALNSGKPVVALESNFIAFGLPYPHNVENVKEAMEIMKAEGVVPAVIALMDGKIKIGLTDEDLDRLGKSNEALKITRCDIAYILATKKIGATTVASTMLCASLAGIKFFATGGPGGVHVGWQKSMDISADLEELAITDVAVICGGPKCILDLPATLEYLETRGVPVVAYGVENLPALMVRDTGLKAPISSGCIKEIADLIRIKWDLGLKGGILIANPVPVEFAHDKDKVQGIIDQANKEAEEKGIVGKDVTPVVLNRIIEMTEGKSLESSINLFKSSVKLGAQIALEYYKGNK